MGTNGFKVFPNGQDKSRQTRIRKKWTTTLSLQEKFRSIIDHLQVFFNLDPRALLSRGSGDENGCSFDTLFARARARALFDCLHLVLS